MFRESFRNEIRKLATISPLRAAQLSALAGAGIGGTLTSAYTAADPLATKSQILGSALAGAGLGGGIGYGGGLTAYKLINNMPQPWLPVGRGALNAALPAALGGALGGAGGMVAGLLPGAAYGAASDKLTVGQGMRRGAGVGAALGSGIGIGGLGGLGAYRGALGMRMPLNLPSILG